MSYPRVQQILEADATFADRVSAKTVEVPGRNGAKVMVSNLAASVHNVLKQAGCNMQSVPRVTILATAARMGTEPVPFVAPAAVTQAMPATPKPVRKKVAEKPAAKPAAPPPKPTPPPPKPQPKPQQSTTKPVVVTTARPGTKVQAEPPVDAGIIHRYQCAVASAQLLAALHQLFEKDDFPGHESRRKKLDDLINEVEQASSQHVIISVKAIIRAKGSIQTKPAH